VVETAATESQSGPSGDRLDLENATISIGPSAASASWASFVMGLDEGFDQKRTAAYEVVSGPFEIPVNDLAAETAALDSGAVAWYQPPVVGANDAEGKSLAVPGDVALVPVIAPAGQSPLPAEAQAEACADSQPAPRGSLAKLTLMPAWAISFLSASASAWLVGRTWTRRKQRQPGRSERPLRQGLGSIFSSLWTLDRRAD
jgi:hypothetical protein